MLERLERMYLENKAFSLILPNVQASMQGVGNSVNDLKNRIESKMKEERGIKQT